MLYLLLMSHEIKWPYTVQLTLNCISSKLRKSSFSYCYFSLCWLPCEKAQLVLCFKHFTKEQAVVSEDFSVNSAYVSIRHTIRYCVKKQTNGISLNFFPTYKLHYCSFLLLNISSKFRWVTSSMLLNTDAVWNIYDFPLIFDSILEMIRDTGLLLL